MGIASSTTETTTSATMAQTYNQAGLEVGSHGPVSPSSLEEVKAKLAALLAAHPELQEPKRAFMDDVPAANWRFGAKPDYTLANYFFLEGKTSNHAEGSLERIVEDLVKTWEMERSHKLDSTSHMSVDHKNFRISANGGKVFTSDEANRVGNYNVLLDAMPKDLYDAEATSWDASHDVFHDCFAAFPWEVLRVFSGPPTVAFTWRHWGQFTGSYAGNMGKGEVIEMFGFAIAQVNDKLQLCDVKVYYDGEAFLKALNGSGSATASAKAFAGQDVPWVAKQGSCPFKAIFG